MIKQENVYQLSWFMVKQPKQDIFLSKKSQKALFSYNLVQF